MHETRCRVASMLRVIWADWLGQADYVLWLGTCLGKVMSRRAVVDRPHSIYVFTVLFLATFLLLFAVFRRPGITYEVQSTADWVMEADQLPSNELESRLLAPEAVLDVMRDVGLIECETTPETIQIAQQIADRIDVHTTDSDPGQSLMLSLVTERPEAAKTLLDGLTVALEQQLQDEAFGVHPAMIVRQRGGRISATGLLVILLVSGSAGIWGIRLNRRADAQSQRDADHIAGIPLLVDFGESAEHSSSQLRTPSQRKLWLLLVLGELAIAGVFALVAVHLVTQKTLANRFISDPLAAYGEILSRVVG